MVVQVTLHTVLQRVSAAGRTSQVQLDLPAGATLQQVMVRLEIEADTDALVLAVNGRTADLNQILVDGDQVDIIPAISGG